MVIGTNPGSVFLRVSIDLEVYKIQKFRVFLLHLGPRSSDVRKH